MSASLHCLNTEWIFLHQFNFYCRWRLKLCRHQMENLLLPPGSSSLEWFNNWKYVLTLIFFVRFVLVHQCAGQGGTSLVTISDSGEVHSVPNKLCSFIFVWNVDGGESTSTWQRCLLCSLSRAAFDVNLFTLLRLFTFNDRIILLVTQSMRIYENWNMLVEIEVFEWTCIVYGLEVEPFTKFLHNLTNFWHRNSAYANFGWITARGVFFYKFVQSFCKFVWILTWLYKFLQSWRDSTQSMQIFAEIVLNTQWGYFSANLYKNISILNKFLQNSVVWICTKWWICTKLYEFVQNVYELVQTCWKSTPTRCTPVQI